MKVPLWIIPAPTDEVQKYQEIADDFFQKVVRVRPLFYSDGSSLRTYEPHDLELAKKQMEEIISRTLAIYGVDITDLYDGPLYKVFERIEKKTQLA